MRFCVWKLCIFAFSVARIHGDVDPDPDPCIEYDVIDAGPRLHSLSNTKNCDNNLTIGWYKFVVAGLATVIPTTCVQNNVCGTQLPLRIELGGNPLPTNGSVLKAHVCTSYNVLGQWDCCVLRQEITIKNCGNFFVYHLLPTDRCPVAYCAEDPDETDYQDISVKGGESVQSTTSPSTDITTQADDTQSQATTITSASTTQLFSNTTYDSSEQPLNNETISTPSLDTTTVSMTTSSDVNRTDNNDVPNVTENIVASSSPSNTTFDDVTEIPNNISSEYSGFNETNVTSILEMTTVAMTTSSVEESTDNITVTNVTDDSASTSTSQPAARHSGDVTYMSTTMSEQASTDSESGVASSLRLDNTTEGTNTTATLQCLSWERSLCPDGQTLCYKSPSSNTYYIQCNTSNGDVCGEICDNFPVCRDEEDERSDLCQFTSCREGKLKCRDEDLCYVRCDGHQECNNTVAFQDENDCPGSLVHNVTTTTELASFNVSTIDDSTTPSTIPDNTTAISSSISLNTSTEPSSDETVTSNVPDITTDSSGSSSTQPSISVTTQQFDPDTTVTSAPLSVNTTIGMDITSQSVDSTTRAADLNSTSEQEESSIPVATSSEPNIPTTDVYVSTNQSQSITDQTTSSSVQTTLSVTSPSNITQSGVTTRMNDSTAVEPTTDSVSATQTQPDSTQTEYTHPASSSYQTSQAPATVSTSTDAASTTSSDAVSTTSSDAASTLIVESSTSTTSRNDTDSPATTPSDSGAVVPTQSTDTVTITSTVASGSSNMTTVLSSNSITSSDTPEHSTVEVPTTTETTVSIASDIPTSSTSLSTGRTLSLSSTLDSSVSRTITTGASRPSPSVASTHDSSSLSSTSDSAVTESATTKPLEPVSMVSLSTGAEPDSSSIADISVTANTTSESVPVVEDDNTTAGTLLPTVNIPPREKDKEKDGLIHNNFGLFVFIVVASTLLVAICIFGTVGYMYQQRRLRTWTPRMAYQDAYADMEKKNLSCPSYQTGIESPIPDIDIMHEEKEEISLSQASTLALRPPANGHENGFEHELRDSPSPKSVSNDSANSDADGGQTNRGFDGDVIDGIVPVEELDDEPPRAFFPWIENAADTKL